MHRKHTMFQTHTLKLVNALLQLFHLQAEELEPLPPDGIENCILDPLLVHRHELQHLYHFDFRPQSLEQQQSSW